MKKFLYIAAISVLLSACTADFEDRNIAVGGDDFAQKIINGSEGCVRGSMLVRFETSAESRLAECATRSGATRTGVAGVDAVLNEVNGYAVEPVFVITDKNRDKIREAGLHLWYEIKFDDNSDIDAVATRLAEVADVQTVQFVHRICRVNQVKCSTDSDLQLMPSTRATTTLKDVFDDTFNLYQWNLHNLGSESKVKPTKINNLAEVNEDADVNAVPAWKLCTGDPSIVVAVLDEGVMNTHEDLADNIWVNTAELNGQEGVDDDQNGFKDDVYGFNFVYMNGGITWDKAYDTGHGSHVAGIVSAVNNNGKGVSSIAGGSGNKDGVKILSAQIFSGADGTTTSNTARAIIYAADNGAHILQCSWGYLSAAASNGYGMPSNDSKFERYSSLEKNAIDYFIKNAGSEDGPIDGGLAIFASGNDAASLPCYPAAYEPCISVSAISPGLRPAFYTNYGIGSDILSPGGESLYSYGEVLSTVPAKFATNGTKNYGMMQGTSQACPHVSGVAALGLSYAKQLGKRYTAKEFRSLLLASTNDINPYLIGEISFQDVTGARYAINYPEYKGLVGNGYIDAYKLLLNIEGTPFEVIGVGEECEIDLSLYFGSVADAQFSKVECDEEEKNAVELVIGDYADGKLKVSCAKSGAATLSVTMLVGGGSLNNSSKPYPTEVTRKFVVIAKMAVASNGGWL